MAMKANVLGLAGAVIGVLAVFSTWLSACRPMNLLDIYENIAHDQLAYWSAVAIILGTLVSFVTQTGALAQIAGMYMWWSWGEDAPSDGGFYVVMASSIILFVSLVRPLGPGLIRGPFTIRNRLLMFDYSRNEEKKGV